MENLMRESTKNTPLIFFDCHTHQLEIKGESYPENTAEFYAPVFSWIDQFLNAVADQVVTMTIDLIYFNSSSSKVLMDLFFKLDQFSGLGKSITVNWIYEIDTEESLEYGREFQEDMKNITFNLIPKEI